MNTHHQYDIMGITTLEKIIEQILSTAILDEKDFEKRMRRQGSQIINDNQYSMTIAGEESHANLNEMTELLNETIQANHRSAQDQAIFNAKFTQLFTHKLVEDVKKNV